MATALLQREAVWALFGGQDDAFRQFWSECAAGADRNPLVSYMLRKFSGVRGLIIIDHVEFLHREGQIDSWFADTFLPAMRQAGIDVVVCGLEPDSVRPLKSLATLPCVQIPSIGTDDIQAWLHSPLLLEHCRQGLDAEGILRVTGGSPALLRDLGNSLLYDLARGYRLYGLQYLNEFERRSAEHYITECGHYIWSARRKPNVLIEGLESLDTSNVSDRQVADRLIASGAVVRTPDGGLQFRSVVHARRVAALTTPENIARLAVFSNLKDFLRSGDLRPLKRYAELASLPLGICSRPRALHAKP